MIPRDYVDSAVFTWKFIRKSARARKFEKLHFFQRTIFFHSPKFCHILEKLSMMMLIRIDLGSEQTLDSRLMWTKTNKTLWALCIFRNVWRVCQNGRTVCKKTPSFNLLLDNFFDDKCLWVLLQSIVSNQKVETAMSLSTIRMKKKIALQIHNLCIKSHVHQISHHAANFRK